MKIQGLNEAARDIHALTVSKGWWEDDRPLPEILMLCVSELSEALDEYRDASTASYFYMGCKLGLKCTEAEFEGRTCPERTLEAGDAGEPCPHSTGKPQGIAVELADCIIRILDYCGRAGIDIEEAINKKHEYNKSRPHRHGGKKC